MFKDNRMYFEAVTSKYYMGDAGTRIGLNAFTLIKDEKYIATSNIKYIGDVFDYKLVIDKYLKPYLKIITSNICMLNTSSINYPGLLETIGIYIHTYNNEYIMKLGHIYQTENKKWYISLSNIPIPYLDTVLKNITNKGADDE